MNYTIAEAGVLTEMLAERLALGASYGLERRYREGAGFKRYAALWALHRIYNARGIFSTALVIGDPAPWLALPLAEDGIAVAVVNDKFFGEFVDEAVTPDREIAIFPRGINWPWTRFFRDRVNTVICLEGLDAHKGEDVPVGSGRTGLQHWVEHLMAPLEPDGELILSLKMKVVPEGVGWERSDAEDIFGAYRGALLRQDALALPGLPGTVCVLVAMRKGRT